MLNGPTPEYKTVTWRNLKTRDSSEHPSLLNQVIFEIGNCTVKKKKIFQGNLMRSHASI